VSCIITSRSVESLTVGPPTAFNRRIVPAEISVLYAEEPKPAKQASFAFKGMASFRASFKSVAAKPSDTVDLGETVRYVDKSPQCALATVPTKEVFEESLVHVMALGTGRAAPISHTNCVLAQGQILRSALSWSPGYGWRRTLLGTGRDEPPTCAGEGMGPETVESK